MAILQTLIAYGNEFTFIAGSAAAFCKPIHRCIPKYVLLTIHDPLDIRFDVVVLMNRDCLFVRFYIKEFGEIVLAPELGILCRGHKILQNFTLCIDGIILPPFNAPEPHAGK